MWNKEEVFKRQTIYYSMFESLSRFQFSYIFSGNENINAWGRQKLRQGAS